MVRGFLFLMTFRIKLFGVSRIGNIFDAMYITLIRRYHSQSARAIPAAPIAPAYISPINRLIGSEYTYCSILFFCSNNHVGLYDVQ